LSYDLAFQREYLSAKGGGDEEIEMVPGGGSLTYPARTLYAEMLGDNGVDKETAEAR
jgi:hypothetical protein